MANQPASKLYTPNLLALATQLADYPLDKEFSHKAQVRSRTCGSTMEIGVDLDAAGCVARLGMQVSACAVGQSSAAIMAAGATGRSVEEIAAVNDALSAWLLADSEDETGLPDWPGLDALKPAREHKGRHGALLLAWDTITRALSTEAGTR
ncbi:iron-sulfur cluster assembly scaffold protein [Erythrobacter longus]|uniref:iron-sulfur cluster assembly scaffold protein n=1 Tax=Erythrobacter longus TaxID=1044 RepID=UPI00068A7307|nr:iron-sulfur cluster assembly scaffold protein [Erythrobacter longus]